MNQIFDFITGCGEPYHQSWQIDALGLVPDEFITQVFRCSLYSRFKDPGYLVTDTFSFGICSLFL